MSRWTDGNVGWFYYQQPNDGTGHPDPCHTIFAGRTDTNFFLTAISSQFTVSQAANSPIPTIGSFPSARWPSPTHGPGDYIGIIKFGLPGGYLFPSWSQGVVTSATGCRTPTCTVDGTSSQYNFGIFGAEVTP